ncbi:MAG: dTMP kinase [Chloroflexi bacterium]|nr:dTMP kinase [Chloroflexota bacterium]
MAEPPRNPARRVFIVFEGGEGSGKSTQARALRGALARQGYSARLTRDPGGTAFGRLCETWAKGKHPVPPQTELLLFAAARSLLTSEVILPGLKKGIVISDRYYPSTVAYQGYGRRMEIPDVEKINLVATKGLKPDLIVLLDVPPELGLARKSGSVADRFHQEGLGFHRRVREGYLAMASAQPDLWRVLDATLHRKALEDSVLEHVSRLIGARRS